MRKVFISICFLLLYATSWGQLATLRSDIEKIISGKNLKVGLALLDLSNGDTLTIHGNDRFPMQSVFKLPLSIAVLHEVDLKRFNLADSIHFAKSELYDHLWSPIQKAYPEGVVLPLSEVIKYTIQKSDNSGCDKLIGLVGGAKNVNCYMHGIGIEQINIKNNEFELQSSWDRQFNNWTTPLAAIQLLKKINDKSLLKEETLQLLWEAMLLTSTGSIREKLPEGAKVAYKTGFSGQNDKGETAANNNIGIMILPDNRRIAYAIFITDSKESQKVNYSVISDIGSCIYHLGDPSR